MRNIYYAKLNNKKKNVLRSSIENYSKDSHKLHALITNLTTNRPENQWPKHKSKQELADGFMQYFHSKILLIREHFKDIAPYQPQEANVPKLDKFAPMSEGDVYKVINYLKSKSCELDVIPMDIFKTLLPTILPLITNIVNISLCEGLFIRKWKTAVVQPLLEKLGLELINPNFRPVSNLSFLSKVIESCMLLQLNQHCKEYGLQPDYQSAYREHHSCETAIL